MDELQPCRSCETKVAQGAPSCPHCGVEWPVPGGAAFWLQGLFLVGGLAVVIIYFLSRLG